MMRVSAMGVRDGNVRNHRCRAILTIMRRETFVEQDCDFGWPGPTSAKWSKIETAARGWNGKTVAASCVAAPERGPVATAKAPQPPKIVATVKAFGAYRPAR